MIESFQSWCTNPDKETLVMGIINVTPDSFSDGGEFYDSRKAIEHGLKVLSVKLKGPGSGRETALRALQANGFKIHSIKDVTPMPHNGARPSKKRRV